jgi:membrane protease subunit HflK
MPWSNQNGGRRGGSGGPWGGPPRGNGPTPPDLDELLRRSQDKIKSFLPGGSGGGSAGSAGLGFGAAALAVVLWAASGMYVVGTQELGVNLIFGRVVSQSTPGFNYNLPYPIGSVYKANVLQVRELTVGTQEIETGRGIQSRDVPAESQMLTGDENLVDVDFKVQWAVKDAAAFLFNIQRPEATVKAMAESAMREVIGQSNTQPILTEDRQKIEGVVRDLMQKTLDGYGAGIEVRLVQMQKVDPPSQVIDAFRDVQAARIDAERLQNEAQTEANRIVPEARGRASAITQEATAYARRIVEEARGQADRFGSVYEEYRKAPDVTRERLYLETMERVLSGMDKTIVDGGNAVQPYLPLDQLRTRPANGALSTTPRTGGQP